MFYLNEFRCHPKTSSFMLQGLNVIYFVLEVLYRFSTYFYVVLAVVFFEGLLGGGAYVNTFFCISKKVFNSLFRHVKNI